jgi:predicted nucleic acid-binding protein
VAAPLVYFDTNALIAGFESPLENATPIHDLLRHLREAPGLAVTSELTLAELLAPAKRPGSLPMPERKRLYLNLLVWSRLFDLRVITREILLETADLRLASPVKLKLPDAIHLVTAIHSECRFFLSDDAGVRPPSGMDRIAPNRSGVDEILSAWSQ